MSLAPQLRPNIVGSREGSGKSVWPRTHAHDQHWPLRWSSNSLDYRSARRRYQTIQPGDNGPASQEHAMHYFVW